MRSRAVRRALQSLLLFGLAANAHADGTWDNCVRADGGVYQYFQSGTVSLGRDAAVGDVVGPWFIASKSPAWTCTRNQGYGGAPVQVSVQGYPPYTRRGTLDFEGSTYGYYAYAASTALSYIVRWRAIVDGVPTAWTPLTIAAGGQQNSAGSVTVTKAVGATYSISVETQMRFVKQSAALTAGFRPGLADPIYVRHYQQVGAGNSAGSGTYRISQMQSGTATFEGGGTCTTPDVTVDLGTTPVASFAGIGTTAARTPFNLSFQNCPAGLASIDYSFTATTSVLNATNGVVALDSSATAKGVGIQLLTGAGNAVQFGTSYPLTAYNPNQKASYTVGMQAGYYQTAASVSAGSARTGVSFTVTYK